MGTATITSLPVTGNTNYTIRYGIDGMTGSVTDDAACADSSCAVVTVGGGLGGNTATLNFDDGAPNDGDNSNMKKYMNHNGTVSNSGNSFGGIEKSWIQDFSWTLASLLLFFAAFAE